MYETRCWNSVTQMSEIHFLPQGAPSLFGVVDTLRWGCELRRGASNQPEGMKELS